MSFAFPKLACLSLGSGAAEVGQRGTGKGHQRFEGRSRLTEEGSKDKRAGTYVS